MTATAKTASGIAPMKPKSWWSENWKPLAVVLALGLLPFLAVLLSGQILFASDQMGSPAWKWYFDGLRRGEFALWDPYFVGGMPSFDANAGSALYIPILILGFLLPVTRFITFDFVLHTLIAGVTSYILIQRYFRLDRWISAALATAYMLNTNFISLIFGGHDGKFHILSWMPLALYFLLQAIGPRSSWKHLLGFSLTIAVFITTSHLQFAYYVIMGLVLAWSFYLIPALKARRFGEAGSLVIRLWVPLLLGIGLIFFMVYPPYQYNKEFSIRGAGPRMTYEHATSWSMHPEETASLIVPEFGGINELYWGRNYFKLNSEYPGLTVWFLGLLGLFAFRTRWFWAWGTVGLCSILYGLGAHTPFFRLFYEFAPGVKNFRAPSMMLLWLAASLLLMSGETLRRLTAVGEGALSDAARAKILRKLKIAGYATAGVLAVLGLFPDMAYGIWNTLIDASQVMNFAKQGAASQAFALGALRTAALVAVLTWAVGAFLLKSRKPAVFGLIALAVTVTDLYWINTNFIQGIPVDRILHHDPAVDYLKTDTSRFRVYGVPGAFEGGVNTRYNGIETVGDRADHELRHYRLYRGNDPQNNPTFVAGLVQNPNGSVSGNTFLDMLNVKYIAFRVPNDPGLKLVVNSSVLPRARFVPAWEAVTDSGAWQGIQRPGFNPRTLAYVTAPGISSGGNPLDTLASSVPVTETLRRYNHQTYTVDAPSEGLLVMSEIWFPHWRARVDGKPADVLRTNFTFRSVRLTPGKHTVEFYYDSPWLKTGALLSGLSALVLALFLFAYRAYGKRKSSSAHA